MDELKPCPFCCGQAVVQGKRVFYVQCTNIHCYVQTDKYVKAKFAIESWNRRANNEQSK